MCRFSVVADRVRPTVRPLRSTRMSLKLRWKARYPSSFLTFCLLYSKECISVLRNPAESTDEPNFTLDRRTHSSSRTRMRPHRPLCGSPLIVPIAFAYLLWDFDSLLCGVGFVPLVCCTIRLQFVSLDILLIFVLSLDTCVKHDIYNNTKYQLGICI